MPPKSRISLTLIALFLLSQTPVQAGVLSWCRSALGEVTEYFRPFKPGRLVHKDWHNGELQEHEVAGMVLNSKAEVYRALYMFHRMYDPAGPRNASLHDMPALGVSGTASLKHYFSALPGAQTDTVLQEILAKIQTLVDEASISETHLRFEYNATGTAFWKTAVRIRKIGTQYVLYLWVPFIENEPTIDIALALGAAVAIGPAEILVSVAANGERASIDLGDALGHAFSQRDILKIVRDTVVASRTLFIPDGVPLKIAGRTYRIAVNMRQAGSLKNLPVEADGTIITAQIAKVGSRIRQNAEDYFGGPYLIIRIEDLNGNPFVTAEDQSALDEATQIVLRALNL